MHAVTAIHWRGYAVHSPMMYRFVRKVVIRSRRGRLALAIADYYGVEHVATYDRVADFEIRYKADSEANKLRDVYLIREPYISAAERVSFAEWFSKHSVVAAHFQGLLVIFTDPKLQKQFYKIRN